MITISYSRVQYAQKAIRKLRGLSFYMYKLINLKENLLLNKRVILNKNAISFENARLLSNVFNTNAEFWINLDVRYQLFMKTETTDEQKVK
jgi:plasmid maintenance system antidote protein VapI